MVILFAHLSSWFMTIALQLSHLKFIAALASLDIHHVVTHLVYGKVLALARPALFWAPV